MTELALFASAAGLVFLLGFQQLNVVGGHYGAAIVTSLFIGSSQIFLWKVVPNATWPEILATIAGGPLGITLSMWFHRRVFAHVPPVAFPPCRCKDDTWTNSLGERIHHPWCTHQHLPLQPYKTRSPS